MSNKNNILQREMFSKSSRSIKSKINSAPVNFPTPDQISQLTLSPSGSCSTLHTASTFKKPKNRDYELFGSEDGINYCSSTYDYHSDSSWSDDLEDQGTKIIKYEYGLVERLLYNEENFSVYNEEFDQWCENFKHLRYWFLNRIYGKPISDVITLDKISQYYLKKIRILILWLTVACLSHDKSV